jgi:hypothetical protein
MFVSKARAYPSRAPKVIHYNSILQPYSQTVEPSDKNLAGTNALAFLRRYDIQHNDTHHIELACDTQYKRHTA